MYQVVVFGDLLTYVNWIKFNKNINIISILQYKNDIVVTYKQDKIKE